MKEVVGLVAALLSSATEQSPHILSEKDIPIGYGAQSQVVEGRIHTVYPHSLGVDAACP